MNNEALQQSLWWLAANMNVWVPPMVMALSAFIIGALQLMAWLAAE